MIRFEYTDGCNQDFIELCHGLDDFLNEIVGGEENRAEYVQYNKLDDIHGVVVAYDFDIPVGSVAFKEYDDECAEVKRVFIKIVNFLYRQTFSALIKVSSSYKSISPYQHTVHNLV